MVNYSGHECKKCGIVFESNCMEDYAYKVKTKEGRFYFCSYKCYNEYLKEREKCWKDRHAEDFENRIEHKKISLYTAYRYQQREKTDGLHLWFR